MNAKITPDHVITIRMGNTKQGITATEHTQAVDLFHALAVLGAAVSTILDETSEEQVREMMTHTTTEILSLLHHQTDTSIGGKW